MFPQYLKKTKKTIAEYKAKHINDRGITEFYEGDEKIAKQLRINCPDTKINFVEIVDGTYQDYEPYNEDEPYYEDEERFNRLYLETVSKKQEFYDLMKYLFMIAKKFYKI